jgi:hypothetical protein
MLFRPFYRDGRAFFLSFFKDFTVVIEVEGAKLLREKRVKGDAASAQMLRRLPRPPAESASLKRKPTGC